MDNLVTNAVACVSVWYETTPPNAAAGFCHAAADFCIKRRRASLQFCVLYIWIPEVYRSVL